MSDLVERLRAIASGLSNAQIGVQKRDVHDAASRITELEEENKRLREALRDFTCPRPINTAPDDTTVGQCVDAGDCGCLEKPTAALVRR